MSPLPVPDTVLDEAIWRTLAYAGLFQYPLRLEELCQRLMDVEAGEARVADRLAAAPLRGRLALRDGFFMPAGCEEWADLRRTRAQRTDQLLADHRRALAVVAHFPFVRLAALSGACAHGNATDDDVDVFLVTRRGRPWMVTLLLMIASKLAGLRRSLCVNYVVSEEGLALPEHDRFTAAEITALRPLAGRETYRRFIGANPWAAAYQPNFFAAYGRDPSRVPERAGSPRLEALLNAVGGDRLETLARRVLEPYLRRRLPGAGVDLSDRRLKLHGHDHRPVVSRAFSSEVEIEGELQGVGGVSSPAPPGASRR